MKAKRVISLNDAKKWANQNRIKYYETSAATGDGVDRLFQDILLSIIERKKLWKKANSAAHPS